MRKLYIIIAFLMLAGMTPRTEASNYHEDFKLYDKTCKKCHPMEWNLWPRSLKSWQLTVENMRTYMYDENAITDDEGNIIAHFLADYAGENVILPPKEEDIAAVEPDPAPQTNSEPLIVVASALPTIMPHLARPMRKRLWNPSRNTLMGARVSGFIAVACLTGLLGSGFSRRKLKRRFRKLHISLAFGLFLSLSAHGIIYICKYGTPSVTWYWFGLIGFIALIVTQVQGIARKRFGKGLLVSHITGACVGLALSILHWIWAWI